MKCPLCKNTNIKTIAGINKDQLTALYLKRTGCNFSNLIKGDLKYLKCHNCDLRFFDPLVCGDENFMNAFQKFDWYYEDDKEEYHYAAKYISSRDKVLEVGAGKGAFVKHLSTKDYVGLELSPNAKNIAAKNNISIENELVQDYAKIHPQSFDIVVSFQVLEHVDDPKTFIEASIELLKDGGKLIIAVPSEDTYLKYLTNGILNMPPHHVTRWSDKTFSYISKHYKLETTDIYHQQMQQTHKLDYLNTLIQNSILKPKMIDTSLKRKLVNKFSRAISRILAKGMPEQMLPNGHSVLVVLTKTK